MSILENNFNQACQKIEQLVGEAKKDNELQHVKYIIVQVAHHPLSFEMHSVALTPSETEDIPDEIENDKYYNMVFITKSLGEVVSKFRDKYLFKLAYADVEFAIYTAYRNALMSQNGEFILSTSFYKPAIKDTAWAYTEVLHYSELSNFRCWLNFDEEFKRVNIQADNDLIIEYNKVKTER